MGQNGSLADDWFYDDLTNPINSNAAIGLYGLQNDNAWALDNYFPMETSNVISEDLVQFDSDWGGSHLLSDPSEFANVDGLAYSHRTGCFQKMEPAFSGIKIEPNLEGFPLESQPRAMLESEATVGAGSWIPDHYAPALIYTNPAKTRVSRDLKHVCKECRKSFKAAYELEDHAKKLNHRSYVCTESACGKSYCRRDVLLRHMLTHKTSEIHCPICIQTKRKRSFKRRDHLVQHMRNRHPQSITSWTNSDHCSTTRRKSPIDDDSSGS